MDAPGLVPTAYGWASSGDSGTFELVGEEPLSLSDLHLDARNLVRGEAAGIVLRRAENLEPVRRLQRAVGRPGAAPARTATGIATCRGIVGWRATAAMAAAEVVFGESHADRELHPEPFLVLAVRVEPDDQAATQDQHPLAAVACRQHQEQRVTVVGCSHRYRLIVERHEWTRPVERRPVDVDRGAAPLTLHMAAFFAGTETGRCHDEPAGHGEPHE